MSKNFDGFWKEMNELSKSLFKTNEEEREKRIKERKPICWKEAMSVLKKEHEETFKDITLDAQLDKFCDENQEFYDAENYLEKSRELADMFIVAAGIARFAPKFVDMVVLPFLMHKTDNEYNEELIIQLALEKSLINKNRKWDKKGGKYQHK